ncbi:hypothetical protein [Nonomuraea fuscirosea]|uniref:hypothetical protein n=1 Tax=Nonomuraea fuscirosea TaxID=1291556 RepID=UPI0033FC89BE
MRLSSAAAALLAPAVIGALGLGSVPAQADTSATAARTAVRAAWIKTCYDEKREESWPCGTWRLLLRDGRQVAVPAAAARGVDGKGRRTRQPATFAISADGRVLAYERARDHRLVVQRADGGPATELPASARPRGVGSDEVALTLSPSGHRVLIDYTDDPERLRTKIITVAAGGITTLPAVYSTQGFSADGDQVLATRTMSDNTTAMYALRPGGGFLKRTPPTIVVNGGTYALDAGGTTVGFFTASQDKPPRVRTYDLASGELSAGADLPLPADVAPYLARWSGGRLTTTITTDDRSGATVVRVLTVDPANGAAEQADKYTINSGYHAYVLAGE